MRAGLGKLRVGKRYPRHLLHLSSTGKREGAGCFRLPVLVLRLEKPQWESLLAWREYKNVSSLIFL